MSQLVEYLQAQAELGTWDVFFDDPSDMPAAPRARAIAPPLSSSASHSASIPTPTPRPAPTFNSPTTIPPVVKPATPVAGFDNAPTLNLLLPDAPAARTSSPDAEFAAIENATSLEAFHEAVMHHPFYRLGPAAPGRIAFGSGPLNPPLMLIGFAPSEEELKLGAFQIGPAAELLRKLLESLHHSRNLCYSTWLVKKPTIKAPLPRQMNMLRRMLAAEVRLVKPQLVLLLGDATYRGVMQAQGGLLDEGGQALQFADTRTTAIIDPAQMIENPALKTLTWKTHLPRSGYFQLKGS